SPALNAPTTPPANAARAPGAFHGVLSRRSISQGRPLDRDILARPPIAVSPKRRLADGSIEGNRSVIRQPRLVSLTNSARIPPPKAMGSTRHVCVLPRQGARSVRGRQCWQSRRDPGAAHEGKQVLGEIPNRTLIKSSVTSLRL